MDEVLRGREGVRRAVLGVDAAWTEKEPSGVALAVETESGWRLAASYDDFLARARGAAPGGERPAGSRPDARPRVDDPAGALIERALQRAMLKLGNVFAHVPPGLAGEETTVLVANPGAVVERIVSTGQASPPGFWYDQDWTEWVMVLAGEAGLRIEGERAPRALRPGDYLELPARVRHRVEWTRADPPTVWLAVHWKNGAKIPRSGEGP